MRERRFCRLTRGCEETMKPSSKKRIAWIAAAAAFAVSWVGLEIAHWDDERDEPPVPNLDAERRRVGTAYGAVEKCLLGDPPLSSSDDAKPRVDRVVAMGATEWPSGCLQYAVTFREASGEGVSEWVGDTGAEPLAAAIESGDVASIAVALDAIRYTTRTFPRDEVVGVAEPHGVTMEIALNDAAVLPGSLGQSPGALGDGPIRLQLHGGPICTFAMAGSIARCAYPRDTVPEAVRYHEFLGDSAADAPALGLFMAAEDRSFVAYELESGTVLSRSQEQSIRDRGMAGLSAAYLDDRGGLTVLFGGGLPALMQRAPDGKTSRRPLVAGSQYWLVGDELFSLSAGATPILTVSSLDAGAAPGAPAAVGPVESALDRRHPVSCGEGDARFVTFWKEGSDETIVIGGNPGRYRILSTSGAGTGVTCHGKTTSLAGAERGGFRRQTCDLDGCKEDKGWSPASGTHAALAVDLETVLLVSTADNTVQVRAASASEIGKAIPTAVLRDWEYHTVRTSWLIGRGDAALLLIETSHGVVPLRVDRAGHPTGIEIEWVEL
jgi:hypothetical protein